MILRLWNSEYVLVIFRMVVLKNMVLEVFKYLLIDAIGLV